MAIAVASAEPGSRKWRLRLPERLPDLKGQWLTFYTIIWAIMFPLSLAGAVIGTYANITTPTTWPPYGFATSQDAYGIRVEAVTSPVARSAGLKVGDYVIEVDGWSVPRIDARAAARGHIIKPDGSFTSFVFRRPSGELHSMRLVRSRAVEEEAFQAAGINGNVAVAVGRGRALLTPLVFIFAAVLLLVRRRRETVPALLSLAFLIFAGLANSPDSIGVSSAVVSNLNTASVLLFFGALFAFPAGRFEPRWTAVPFMLLPVLALTWFFFEAAPQSQAVAIAFLLMTLTALIARYRTLDPGAERQQLRWAFFGLAIGLFLQIIIVFTQTAATAWQGEDPRWVVWDNLTFNALDALSACAFTLGLIISILRYRLYDADAVIGRSAAYGILTLGFVVLFAGSQKIIELIGQEYLGQNIGGLAGGIGAALAAVAISPLHSRAQRWAERRFQNNLYRLRRGLPALVGDLRETSGVGQIAGATLDALVDGVQASRASLIANEQLIDARNVPAAEVREWWSNWTPTAHDGIDCDRSDQLFPVRVPLEAEGHGRVGWLLLGARPDGSMFGKSECDVIEEIAEPVARALEVAMTRAAREERYEHRFDTIEKQLTKLAQVCEQLRRQLRSPPA